MQLKRVFPLLALTLIATTGCQDTQARADIATMKGEIATIQSQIAQLTDWLGKSPNAVQKTGYTVHVWHQSVFKAICNLEQKANPPAADRLCHAEISLEHNAPPNPPPWL